MVETSKVQPEQRPDAHLDPAHRWPAPVLPPLIQAPAPFICLEQDLDGEVDRPKHRLSCQVASPTLAQGLHAPLL